MQLSAQSAGIRQAAGSDLTIIVIKGDGAANTLHHGAAVQPILEVRDRNNHPVPAAIITLQAPMNGPGVLFSNGARTTSVVTEVDGRASVTGMTPEGAGSFAIAVTASHDGSFGNATIHETNYAARHTSKALVIAIVAGVAAGAATGIVLATRGHGYSASGSTIGAGTPTVGAPQ